MFIRQRQVIDKRELLPDIGCRHTFLQLFQVLPCSCIIELVKKCKCFLYLQISEYFHGIGYIIKRLRTRFRFPEIRKIVRRPDIDQLYIDHCTGHRCSRRHRLRSSSKINIQLIGPAPFQISCFDLPVNIQRICLIHFPLRVPHGVKLTVPYNLLQDTLCPFRIEKKNPLGLQ